MKRSVCQVTRAIPIKKGVSRILCKLKNAVQIEQIYSKGAARKSAVPFAVILAVNLPYVKDQ